MRLTLKGFGDEGGFAFIVALLALLIMTSLSILIFDLTGRDVRVSLKSTGEKVCISAAETGIQNLLLQSNISLGVMDSYTATNVSAGATSLYSISSQVATGVGSKMPASRPLAGYQMAGTGAIHDWSEKIFNKTVSGTDTRYIGEIDMDIGVGYGPVDMSTSQPAAGG
jgi:hypothetical protein